MTKPKKKPDSPCIGKDIGKPESLYAAGGNIKWYNHVQKQFGSFFKSSTYTQHVTGTHSYRYAVRRNNSICPDKDLCTVFMKLTVVAKSRNNVTVHQQMNR